MASRNKVRSSPPVVSTRCGWPDLRHGHLVRRSAASASRGARECAARRGPVRVLDRARRVHHMGGAHASRSWICTCSATVPTARRTRHSVVRHRIRTDVLHVFLLHGQRVALQPGARGPGNRAGAAHGDAGGHRHGPFRGGVTATGPSSSAARRSMRRRARDSVSCPAPSRRKSRTDFRACCSAAPAWAWSCHRSRARR
jgi:hypothetical protein